MATDPATLAETYFRAWQEGDADALRAVLADDVTFRGPLGTADGVEACLQGLQGLGRVLTGIAVQRRWVDGDDVVTWFDLQTSVAPAAPTVNWSRVRDGRIAAIRVTFDPRELLSGLGR
ncbi:nuclear transport factor 2 family protein [Geodermatophilus sp. SYSU D01105]